MYNRCPGCGSMAVRPARMPYYYGGQLLGYFEAVTCSNCNSTYFTQRGIEEINRRLRQKGVVTSGVSQRQTVGVYYTPTD